MLFLLFQLGNDRYALEARRIVEVLPLVIWKRLPQSPPGVAGVFNYHGTPVPLLDLSELALGSPARSLMSTRVILVEYPAEESDEQPTHLLGLIAEQTTATLQRTPEEFVDTGVTMENANYLGSVTTDAGDIVQRVEVEQLLSYEVRNMLFRMPMESV